MYRSFDDEAEKISSTFDDDSRRGSTAYRSAEKVVYTVRCFPDEEAQEQLERRLSIPASIAADPGSRACRGRRHSEVILSPSGVFNRDYFNFSDEAIFGRAVAIRENAASGREAFLLNPGKRYVNPLEVSANGNEVITYNSDELYDDDIGRPRSHSTPKTSVRSGGTDSGLNRPLMSAASIGNSPEKSVNGVAVLSTDSDRIRSSFRSDAARSDETLNRQVQVSDFPRGKFSDPSERLIIVK